MAKNWTISEAAEAILSGNKEDIIDIGKRFPLVLNAISLMGKNEGGMAIIGAIPPFITARKVEAILKDGVSVLEDEIEDPKELEVEEPKKETKKKASRKVQKEDVDVDTDDYEDMSEIELFKLCKSKGIKALPKKNKDYYIDLLTNSDDEDEGFDEDDEEPEEKPVKKAKKVEKPVAKKVEKPVAKKSKKETLINKPVVEDDDDDDDWDI